MRKGCTKNKVRKKKKSKVGGKVLKKILKKIKKENGIIECWFCGSKKNLEQHHIIPKELGGTHLKNNKVWVCDRCHPQLHKLLTPVIDYLVAIIKSLQNGGKIEEHRIGYIWENGKKLKKGGKVKKRPL